MSKSIISTFDWQHPTVISMEATMTDLTNYPTTREAIVERARAAIIETVQQIEDKILGTDSMRRLLNQRWADLIAGKDGQGA